MRVMCLELETVRLGSFQHFGKNLCVPSGSTELSTNLLSESTKITTNFGEDQVIESRIILHYLK